MNLKFQTLWGLGRVRDKFKWSVMQQLQEQLNAKIQGEQSKNFTCLCPGQMNALLLSFEIKYNQIHSLEVILVWLVAASSIVVSIVVALLLYLGQPVHQVIRWLVGDVWENPVHQRFVPLQLVLDCVTETKYSFKSETGWTNVVCLCQWS